MENTLNFPYGDFFIKTGDFISYMYTNKGWLNTWDQKKI